MLSEDDRCRGPMARAIAERFAAQEHIDSIVFDSAGLTATPGEPATTATIAFMRREKYNLAAGRSKPITDAIADSADVIFCMTRDLAKRTRAAVGDYYAPKVVLLTEGVDLVSNRMDIDRPGEDTVAEFRKVYAALRAALGRLIRTLEEPGVTPEYFGAVTLPKRNKPGTGGTGPRATAENLDPEKRRFLSNSLFDYIERSFEPPTTAQLLEHMAMKGMKLSQLEVEEVLRQDLHGHVRVDRDGCWNVVAGASTKRRDDARAEARARAAEAAKEQEKARQSRAAELDSANLSEADALEVLGIRKTTPFEEARKKYRSLLQRYHPDKFHDDDEFREMAESKARRINTAWTLVEDLLPKGEESPEV
jgi:protein-tyrosine-phosphatase